MSEQQWEPAPHAGTPQVALQSQLGVRGEVSPPTSLNELWGYIGRSTTPSKEWAERVTQYVWNKAAESKTQLPAVNVSTICQTVNGTPAIRRIENISHHTGLIVLDYDKVGNAMALVGELNRCEHVLGAFVSPSGTGVKAIVPVSPTPSCVGDHESAFQHVVRAVAPRSHGCMVDKSGRDPVRLMFAYAHIPFNKVLNRDATPVKWWPRDPKPKPAVAPSIDEPVNCDELRACLNAVNLSSRDDWLIGLNVAVDHGLSFEEWDVIASKHAGYKGTKEQLRQWNLDKRRGKKIPAKAIFAMAKRQGLKAADWMANMSTDALESISSARKAPERAKSPISKPEPSGPKETASTAVPEPGPNPKSKPRRKSKAKAKSESKSTTSPDTASKSNQVLMAREFAKHCDESNKPVRHWTQHYWLRYGKHGWEQDVGEVELWDKLTHWAESPAGVELQAPLSNSGLEGVERLVRRMVTQNDWDIDHRVGLPERGVLELNADASVGIDQGNWETYISKRAGALLGAGDTPEDALWKRCVNEWMPAIEVASYVQILLGAALFGHAVETRSVLYIQSSSQYGKSTFLNAVRNAFGEYAKVAPSEVFTKKSSGSDEYQIARLEGVRLAVASEIPSGIPLNAARIKSLAGGEEVVGRHLYKAPFAFMPQALLVLSGNHDPYMTGGESEGMKQRMRIVRWPKRGFSKPDRQLTDKLATPAARAAILRWVVSGAQHYMAGGMPETPESMQTATNAYFETADFMEDFKKTLKFFKDEEAQKDEEGKPVKPYYTPIRELTAHLKRYCDEEGLDPKRIGGSRRMNAMYSENGCEKVTRRVNGKNTACWLGVKIIRHIDPLMPGLSTGSETTPEAPY